MRTIAVVGRKGGSGKTTLATQLAIGAWRRGRQTLLADIDPQRSSMEVLKPRSSDGPACVASSGSKLFALQTASKRDGYDALIIDTAAVDEEALAAALVVSDLAVMVLRPTFLDLAAAVNTSSIIRQLRKPGIIVLNQAPVARGPIEPPQVKRALEALQLLRLPVAPTIMRSRLTYQIVLEKGVSAEELSADVGAGLEIATLCDYLDRLAFGPVDVERAGGTVVGWAGGRPV